MHNFTMQVQAAPQSRILGRTVYQAHAPFRCRKRSRHLCGASISEKVNDALEGETMNKWTTCVNRIEELGLEGADAETVVGQAFGWGKQSYWLNKKKEQVPDLGQIEAVLAFLEGELDLKGDDLKKVVKSFPEVINCNVERRLKANVEHMQKAYYMKGPAVRNTVKRMPAALGYTGKHLIVKGVAKDCAINAGCDYKLCVSQTNNAALESQSSGTEIIVASPEA